MLILLSYLSFSDRENVGVTGVGDRHNGNTVESTARGTEVDVVTRVVVNVSLGQHSVVLELRTTKSGAVGRDHQELGLSRSQSLQSALQAKGVLTRLDDQLKLAVDAFSSLSSLLRGHY